MIDSNNELKKLSKSLISAVRGVMEGKEGGTPKTEKEKDLAAKAPPHDKVTHADVLVGRGVLKKHPKTGKLVTKEETEAKPSGLDIARNVLNKMRNEEAEQIDEAKREHVATVGDWHIHHSEDPGSGEDRYHFKHKTTGKSGGYMQVNPYFNKSKETHAQSVHRQAKSWGASDEEAKHIVSHQNKLLGKNEEYQIDELSTDTLRKYREGARQDAFDADAVDDERRLRKRSFHHNLAGKKIIKRGDTLRKEETELDEALDAAARYGDHHTAIKSLLKSISQHVEAHKTDALKHRDYRGKKGVNWGHVGDLAQVHSQLADIHDRLAQQGEYKKTIGESVELDEAPVDGVAAGSMDNDGHLCATKVFHKEWAEGTPIFSQHAEPDENGDIAWYDVMFEHGIEKNVSIEDLDVLMSETHERHGKRKTNEEVDLDESVAKVADHLIKRYGDNVRKSHVRSAAGDFGVGFVALSHHVRKKLGVNRLEEDTEELDEVSAATKDAYAQKAAGQLPGLFKKSGSDADAARKYYNRKNTVRKIANEEVEEIDELSKGTLASYVNKAAADVHNSAYRAGKTEGKGGGYDTKNLVKSIMRQSNINKAAKKLAKEDIDLEEARGRPRKNPLPAGEQEEPEPRQHIIQQLQRAKLSMRGGEHVTFKDGTKHHVSGQHAEKILAKYSSMKPAGKEEFQKKISASHAAFKEEL